ncbi:DMT family transporter, partial [Patescibacteria group bacterium]|nr:DMT family transporter [Patescibacteria group bacterium]
MMPKFSHMSGIKLAFITAIISGFAVFINKFGVSLWANSSAYTTAKNVAATIFLTAIILLCKKQAELRHLSKKQWSKLLLIGFIGGSVPFLLFFKSLTLVSAAEAAFIHKTLFIWVAILAV